MLKYVLLPWMLFLFIMFISMYPWWFIILVFGMSVFAAVMDCKNARRRERQRRRNMRKNQLIDDFPPVY